MTSTIDLTPTAAAEHAEEWISALGASARRSLRVLIDHARTVTLEQRIDAARRALAAVVPQWSDLTRGQVLDVIDRLDNGAEALDAGRAIDPDLDLDHTIGIYRVLDAVADAGRAARVGA